MAHHDSKSQSLTLPYRAGSTFVALAGSLLLLGLVVVGVVAGRVPGPAWLAPVCGVASSVAALFLATMKSGNRSPGGVDNAGSVAILLELARLLPAELPGDVELIFLSTGAEEDHMIGAMRWLDAHVPTLGDGPVYCLNFDGAGSPGRLVLLERYGFGKMFSPAMSAAARLAAARLGYRIRGIVQPPAMGIDAIPFSHRGIPCLTLSSGSLGRATVSVHSTNDHAHHLDAATLEAAARLGRMTLLELAKGY
jgi:Zn-dependent M28 family amino/carboxypeptidase